MEPNQIGIKMKPLNYIFAVVLCMSFSAAQAQNQKEEKKKYEMKTYYLVLLKKGPNRNQDSVTVKKLQEGHIAHLTKMAEAGKMDIAGPISADMDLRGICIYNVTTKEEAEALVKEDPMIKAGRLSAEVLPFYSAKGATLK